MSPRSKEKRGPRTSRDVSALLRRDIVRGTLAPGSMLPRRIDLQERFGVSTVTMQRAIDTLRREGFIRVHSRQATYVSDRPPHLFHYALVFVSSPSNDEPWSRIYQALANEATGMDRQDPRKVKVLYGIDGHADNEDYQVLVSDLRAHRYAGVIFASHPFVFAGTPLLDDPGIPRVAFMEESPSLPQVAGVGTAGQPSFAERAVDYLLSRGRRRIACLSNTMQTGCAEVLVSRGAEVRPYWHQVISNHTPETASAWMQLMFRENQADRPDGLIITDDNLVEHATAGLVAAHVRIPAELDVVAHVNFPWPTPSVVPVKRLGYDVRKILATCMQLIDEQRQGKPARQMEMPAVFEEELAEAARP